MKYILILLFTVSIYSQSSLIRRAELGDLTAVLRTLVSAYDLDSTNAKSLINDSLNVFPAYRLDGLKYLFNDVPKGALYMYNQEDTFTGSGISTKIDSLILNPRAGNFDDSLTLPAQVVPYWGGDQWYYYYLDYGFYFNDKGITADVDSIEIRPNENERVDGWYYDDVGASLSDEFMGRGFGRMGSAYRISRSCRMSQLSVFIAPGQELKTGTIEVDLFVNGDKFLTIYIILNPAETYEVSDVYLLALDLAVGDYLQLGVTTSADLDPLDLDIDAVIELEKIERGR